MEKIACIRGFSYDYRMENGLDIIKQAEREIRRDAEDLTRLKFRYPGYDFVKVDQSTTQQANSQSSGVELSQLERDVIRVMHSMTPDTQWTSRTVVTGMQTQNLRLPEKDDAAMNAVAYALVSLRDKKKIIRTHEGRGRDPHRYQLVQEDKVPSTETRTPSQ